MKRAEIGIWMPIGHLSAQELADVGRRAEAWGYASFWIPETVGRDSMIAASWLLANTTALRVATGIANIYSRDGLAAKDCQYALAEQSGGRFLLGLGVSHMPLVTGLRGHAYQKPLSAMEAYLAAMAKANYMGAQPVEAPGIVLAALGPRMLELAATHADGAHTYNVTPEHTHAARAILGSGKLLCPEQMVVLETDPARARAIARRTLGHSIKLPNYRNSFARMGFAEEDMASDGSNRLIDAIVAWGDEDAIRARIQAHPDAGADHVCIQALPREGLTTGPEELKALELLAPA